MTHGQFGKIAAVTFGYGGYQDAQFGVSFQFSFAGSGVYDFWGQWGIKWREGNEWTEETRIHGLGEMCMRLKAVMDDAKVQKIEDLVGRPIEVMFDGNKMVSWRILTEVL